MSRLDPGTFAILWRTSLRPERGCYSSQARRLPMVFGKVLIITAALCIHYEARLNERTTGGQN